MFFFFFFKIQETELDSGELKTKIDLGCNFYVQAKVYVKKKIYKLVNVAKWMNHKFKLNAAQIYFRTLAPLNSLQV